MSRLFAFVTAILAIAFWYTQRESFRAAEFASEAQPEPSAAPAPEQVVIDGKLYPKNARGVYMVNGVPTFVKKEKLAAAPAQNAPAATGEVMIDPSVMQHRIDNGN